MIKILAVLFSIIFALTGCSDSNGTSETAQASGEGETGSSWRTEIPRIVPTSEAETEPETAESSKEKAVSDILILYTGDVDCSVNDGIGYAGVAAMKKELEKTNEYVVLADCGDATRGAEIGEASEGLYIIDIMNHLGYDLAVPGDRDFGYGMEALQKNVDQANFPYIACNLTYDGDGEDTLSNLSTYVIREYGGVKAAFVGVTTPRVLEGDEAESFKEDGECIYDMCAGDGSELYERIQENVDAARDEGADYVILVSHLGTEDEIYGADVVAAHTDGIDAILDGGSRTAVSEQILENKSGDAVILSQTGEKLAVAGLLTITAQGNISATVISSYPEKDALTQSMIDGLMVSGEEDAPEQATSGGKS